MTRRAPRPTAQRRHKALLAELQARAKVWLPEWQPRTEADDFMRALFEVTARIESEITQRMERLPEKAFRGFLDWLGVRGKPANSARLAVVFDLRSGSTPVLANPPVQVQALGADPPVSFETETPLMILPGRITSVVGVAPGADRYHRAPGSLVSLEPPSAVPRQWTAKSDPVAGISYLQLEPERGLAPGLELRGAASGTHYTVTAVEKGIATIVPAYDGTPLDTVFERRAEFAPADRQNRNQQFHALYLGSNRALDVESAAVIEIVNGGALPSDLEWAYWGKLGNSAAGWQTLAPPQLVDGKLYLIKQGGSVEPTDIEGRSSRWLRAVRAPGGFSAPTHTSNVQLAVNCKRGQQNWPPGLNVPTAGPKDGVKLEGIANTAPLVLDRPFYPLGREPRLFDSFYLGSKEAFSKPGASVDIRFKMGDTLSAPPAAISSAGGHVIVGIGLDGKLHRAVHTGAATVTFLGAFQPIGADGHPVTLASDARPGAALGTSACVTVAGAIDGEVWFGSNVDASDAPRWTSLHVLPKVPAQNKPVRTVLVRTAGGTGLHVYAAANGPLYERPAPAMGRWTEVRIDASNPPIAMIAPVVRHDAAPGDLHDDEGLVAISALGELYFRDRGVSWRHVALTRPIDPNVYPLVVRHQDGRLFAYAREKSATNAPGHLIAFEFAKPDDAKTRNVKLVGRAFDFVWRSGRPVLIAVIEDDDGIHKPAQWDPFDGNTLLVADAPPEGKLIAAPVVLGQRNAAMMDHLFPGDDGVYFVRTFLAGAIDEKLVGLTDAVLFRSRSEWQARRDLWIALPRHGEVRPLAEVQGAAVKLSEGEWALLLRSPLAPRPSPIEVAVYQGQHRELRRAERVDANRLRLRDGDNDAVGGGYLYVVWRHGSQLCEIATIEQTPGDPMRVARLRKPPPVDAKELRYKSLRALEKIDAALRPAINLQGFDPAIVSRLGNGLLYLPKMKPARQTVLHVLSAPARRAVLALPWQAAPAAPYRIQLIIDATYEDWHRISPPRPQSPALSWEFWDGSGWWQIPNVNDETAHLVRDGRVSFCVPSAIASTDVVGRSNYWVRARLVGGDYGQEKVTIESITDPSTNKTTQTVKRNTDAIRAPYVISIEVSYELCCPVAPDVVLAYDAGAARDLTDANKAAGAIVELFLPLMTTLARAGALKSREPTSQPASVVAPCVDCVDGEPWSPSTQVASTAEPEDGERAVYIGLDAPLADGPVTLLVLAEKSDQQHAFPLRVDVLQRQGFAPVVAEDGTRGMGESGVIRFTVGEPAPKVQLFGDTCCWIRLRPREGAASARWEPQLRAAYLNGVYAAAAVTRTGELLGSSDGSPGQQVQLKQPPIVAGSLRLRVRERLSDEEISELRAGRPEAVRDEIEGRPGPWVLWNEVLDPDDEPADARVYSMDDETGTLRFGDGVHGRVPPAGSDVILAERYRTGGGGHANDIAAWSTLNLITPLQGVERTVAPEGAAGGADPQDLATTLRFATANLAIRDRALTLRDLEVLALESSRDIVQARALPDRTGIRLVTVVKGDDPQPSPAAARELLKYLTARVAPTLGVPGAIKVVGPRLRRVEMKLRIVVDSIERSGGVGAEVRKRMMALLDPTSGGLDGVGWRLGDVPTDAEVAAALADIPHLDGIDSIEIRAIDATAPTLDLSGSAQPGDLIRLAPDGVEVEFAVTRAEELQ